MSPNTQGSAGSVKVFENQNILYIKLFFLRRESDKFFKYMKQEVYHSNYKEKFLVGYFRIFLVSIYKLSQGGFQKLNCNEIPFYHFWLKLYLLRTNIFSGSSIRKTEITTE